MNIRCWLMIALMTLGVGTALPVNAASIEFFGPSERGTISYAGGDSPLLGTNIPVSLSSDNFFTSGGNLAFSTGPFDQFVGNGGGIAYFTPGGQITITGTLVEWQPGGPRPPQVVYSGLMFSGAFTGTPGNRLIGVPGANPSLQFAPLEPQNSVDARLQGSLHPTFASLLGLPSDVLYEGGLGTAIAAAKWSFGPVSGPVYSALGLGLSATAVPVNPIPEPSTMLLVASGLAGLGLWRHRRSAKQQAKPSASSSSPADTPLFQVLLRLKTAHGFSLRSRDSSGSLGDGRYGCDGCERGAEMSFL